MVRLSSRQESTHTRSAADRPPSLSAMDGRRPIEWDASPALARGAGRRAPLLVVQWAAQACGKALLFFGACRMGIEPQWRQIAIAARMTAGRCTSAPRSQ